MKRSTASQLKSRLSEVLDAAERGQPVIVERRGTRFTIAAERSHPARKPRRSLIAWMDPAVEAGQWTWDRSPGRMRFRSRLKKTKKR